MNKKQKYITDEETINCQKVADVFTELYESEDLLVLNAGRYGFVKLQYFNVQFGFDTAYIFVDSQSLFDDLWREWLYTQLLDLAEGTPMEDMDYGDIFKCLPKEKQKELSDKRISFAEKTGIANLLFEKKKNRKNHWKIYLNRLYLAKGVLYGKSREKNTMPIGHICQSQDGQSLRQSSQQKQCIPRCAKTSGQSI